MSLGTEANAAVKALGWKSAYYVDAGHIRLETEDQFIAPADFFTIDLADSIGKSAGTAEMKGFIDRHPELVGTISIPHIECAFAITRAEFERVANKFSLAVQDAGRIYQHIVKELFSRALGKAKKVCVRYASVIEFDESKLPPAPVVNGWNGGNLLPPGAKTGKIPPSTRVSASCCMSVIRRRRKWAFAIWVR